MQEKLLNRPSSYDDHPRMFVEHIRSKVYKVNARLVSTLLDAYKSVTTVEKRID